MRRVRGIAQEHHILRMPPRVAHGGKPPPQRTVLEQTVPLQLLGEERLAEGQGRILVVFVEAGRLPRCLGRLHDERGAAGRILVGVNPPEPVHRLLEEEREGGKRARGAEPDEAIGPPLELGAELRGVPVPQGAAHAVRGDHHVRRAERGRIGHFDTEAEVYLQVTGAASQDAEQGSPFDSGEAVPGRGDDRAAIVDVDVLPSGQGAGHLLGRLGIGLRQILLRCFGKHHAEAERIVHPVSLEHQHFVAGVGPLHQDGEVETGRSAPDNVNLHAGSPGCQGGATRRRRPSAVSARPASSSPL